MHRLRGPGRGGRVLVALAVGGAMFGIASAVQASIPDASGVIHGCYFKFPNSLELRQGALRVIDTGAAQHCRPDETALNWNQKGVTGATGPTGPSGPAGTGTATTVTADEGLDHYVDLGGSSAGTDLATLNIPTGSFVIFARAVAIAGSTNTLGNILVDCKLTAGTDSDPASGGRISFGADYNSITHPVTPVVSLNVLHTFASPGTATLNCASTVNQDAKAGDVRITAIQVSNIS